MNQQVTEVQQEVFPYDLGDLSIENCTLVAVYGTLRAGNGNHRLLEGQQYLGTFTTDPCLTMYTTGGFPILTEGSNTVVMEVYRVPELAVRKRIDQLEGYRNRSEHWYDKKLIETPYGYACFYIQQKDQLYRSCAVIESGDWHNK